MFPRNFNKLAHLQVAIETFREKGAVTPQNAISLEESGLSTFNEILTRVPGRLGVFVEVNGKFYLSEKRLKEVRDQLRRVRQRRVRHLLRHTASVPKGFLRHYLLYLLREKPMSGSEIMEAISKQTCGRWKPSPGSVYPLLAWFKDNALTEDVPTEESGMKRYQLTEKGIQFFEEQIGDQFQKKLEFAPPFFFEGFGRHPFSQKTSELHEPVLRFMKAVFNLRVVLRRDLSEQTIQEVQEFLNETADKIEELGGRIRKGE